MLLDIGGVEVGYGRTQVLRGVSIQVAEGTHIGLFGPNGHGKTTLLRTISGLIKPWRGEIRLRDELISDKAPREIVELGLIHVPQGNQLFREMTVLENLTLGAWTERARAKAKDNFERVYALFPRLAERRSQFARTLSGGERQMLSIAVGLMCEPRMLMLDEPSLGLAPKLKDEVAEAIGRIAKTGVPFILVDQDIEFLMGLTDQLYMIDHGEVVLEFASGQALDHRQIMEMYFGTV
ncbi:MAG: ABC transporter ATP-binding protein [Alphaproteobacteria bacterium]|nr:ABC transporter ATP-binding protein [Alphaproteobacteria bacterium]